jgi:glucose-1-phosphate cytidylyltransferase
MKVILLAGGVGTRISEETVDKPKPMVLLDDKPIIWHLMSIFAAQGHKEFLIATGYKSEVIDDWVSSLKENWSVETLFTGQNTQTGGRIKECMKHLPGERVFATYGDGLANVNLSRLKEFHQHHGKKATLTAVRPPARFGVLESSNGVVTHFGEKNQVDAGWINGGFFVLEPEVEPYILNLDEPFETGAIPRLVNERNIMGYHHANFWQPMDTLREKQNLAKLASERIPIWLRIEDN